MLDISLGMLDLHPLNNDFLFDIIQIWYSTEEDEPKIKFFNCAKNIFCAQNVLDSLLSLYMYFFIPKVFLKMLNLRGIKND